ncbi:pentatricopeptide repeat-containing protein, mitochondrial [Cocos nucifera]|uniref:Pentatricopeptide repeat-containing protein, mitochondrial n=1 Tax=Cocos nucifera TaxID=13894 RepID=A0A8K0MY59_COCNU|nr:pentatricopeptide repeat-containing protein, mitochondrial [Cocos nucifera]
MIKTGLNLLPFPTSKLLAAAALLDAPYARSIFDRIHTPNLFNYNTLLRAYSIAPNPAVEEALPLFKSVKAQEIPLDQFSFISTLKLCARCLALETGRQLHGSILRSGFQLYLIVRNILIHFYCACGGIAQAHQLFDEMPQRRDAVSWSALIGGYLQISQPGKAIGLFREMHVSGSEINAASIVGAFSASSDACGRGGALLHGYCLKVGLCSDLNVATAIVTMYVRTGCMGAARQVFDVIPRRDLVLYNCMVDGYAKGGLVDESLALVHQMKYEGVRPNAATFVGLLSSCASSGALVIGRRIHEHVKEECLELDAALGTAFVDLYSKCGCLDKAIEVFDRMRDRDVKAWTSMILGFGVNGWAAAALQLFYEMEEKGVKPNEVTFLAILSACGHGGLVEAGKELFERMVHEYGLSPRIEHYGCMIDLLGRAGLLEEACELIKSLPLKEDAVAWRALLAACKVHGNIELGEMAQQALVALCDEQPTDSILLSSTYALAGQWVDVARVRDLEGQKMMDKKEPGCSLIEIGG